jgi:uncharacterized protein YyaL (SSP411 family)
LLALYADGAVAIGDGQYRDVARGIVGWLVREMRAPDGAFYSSLDADSEGEEGRFYVWQRDEARDAMRDDEWKVAEPYFGFDRPPNFEGHAWHLRVMQPLDAIAAELDLMPPDAQTRLVGAKAALFAARERRVRPGRDEKILTAWNALSIGGLARAARALDQPRWTELACSCADTLRRTAWQDGRLLATRRGDHAALNAYLDDHAFLLKALLELMQAQFRLADLTWARSLADALLDRFEDQARGGFFFTSHDHEKLFHRGKPGHDQATPSGNGVAAQALIVLGHLLGEYRYLKAAERTVRVFAEAMVESPSGFASLLQAFEAIEAPPTQVLLQGDRALCAAWQRTLQSTYRPRVLVFNLAGVDDLPTMLVKGPVPRSGAVAWVCRGTHCLPALTSIEAIERELESTANAGVQRA